MHELVDLASIAPVVVVGVVILIGTAVLMGVLVRVVSRLLAELRKNNGNQLDWESCPIKLEVESLRKALEAHTRQLDCLTQEQASCAEQQERASVDIADVKRDTFSILGHLTNGNSYSGAE